jgi:hypothetical protein
LVVKTGFSQLGSEKSGTDCWFSSGSPICAALRRLKPQTSSTSSQTGEPSTSSQSSILTVGL